MQRVISYHAADDAEGETQPQEFNASISKRACISLGLSLSFFTMIIGTLLILKYNPHHKKETIIFCVPVFMYILWKEIMFKYKGDVCRYI